MRTTFRQPPSEGTSRSGCRSFGGRIFGSLFFLAFLGMGTLFEVLIIREFVREKYGTDEALRAAWRDEEVTLGTVCVPSEEQWRRKRREMGIMHWPDPAEVQRERDYFLLQKQIFHRYFDVMFSTLADATKDRPVIKGGDLLKLPLQGWLLNPQFQGEWTSSTPDQHCHMFLATGAIGIGPLMDHPGLDMIQTPGMYYNRAMGYAWESEGASDPLTLRGKLNYMEADMRAWSQRDREDVEHDAGTFMTPAEADAGHARTMAWAATRNQMYYMSAGRGWPPQNGSTRLVGPFCC